MKKMTLAIMFALFFAPNVFCQMDEPLQDAQQDFKIRQMKLDFEERQAEMKFRNEIRNIKLQQKRSEVNRMNRQAPGQMLKKVALRVIPVVCILLHILLTVWVYQDLKIRAVDGGLWIFIVLLSGCFGALIYSQVRLGDLTAVHRDCCEPEGAASKKK